MGAVGLAFEVFAMPWGGTMPGGKEGGSERGSGGRQRGKGGRDCDLKMEVSLAVWADDAACTLFWAVRELAGSHGQINTHLSRT